MFPDKLKSHFSIFTVIFLLVSRFYISTSANAFQQVVDINVGEIPVFVLSKDVELSPNFLKLCRLLMFTMPIDQEADNLELNMHISIPITKNEFEVSTLHPLQNFSNRTLVLSYTAGRNVVVTAGHNPDDHIVFITGMGSKCDEKGKTKLEATMKARIFDIIDVLSIDIENKQSFRNELIDYTKNIDFEKYEFLPQLVFITYKQNITDLLDKKKIP